MGGATGRFSPVALCTTSDERQAANKSAMGEPVVGHSLFGPRLLELPPHIPANPPHAVRGSFTASRHGLPPPQGLVQGEGSAQYTQERPQLGLEAPSLSPEETSNTRSSALAAGTTSQTRDAAAQTASTQDVEAELRNKDRQISRLQTTLSHWRTWAAEIAARYASYNPDLARPARRIYVGGLPLDVSDTGLRQFFNQLMIETGGATAPGFPIMSCKLYPEKSYAFMEFRTIEEASNCMALDGVRYLGCHLRVRRPNNYVSNVASVLGPLGPDPGIDLSMLKIVRTVVPDSPSKLFIGGLPCDWNEEQVKELILPYGELRAFNLVMDKNTGNSKGYAFAEMLDTDRTDYVVQNLNGRPVGNKFLTVKRALVPGVPQFTSAEPTATVSLPFVPGHVFGFSS